MGQIGDIYLSPQRVFVQKEFFFCYNLLYVLISDWFAKLSTTETLLRHIINATMGFALNLPCFNQDVALQTRHSLRYILSIIGKFLLYTLGRP